MNPDTRVNRDERAVLEAAEAAARLSENRLKLALQASNASVWELDVQTGELIFSRELAPMLGYSEGKIPSRIEAWESYAHPEDLSRLKDALRRHYRGEIDRVDVEYRMRTSADGWMWLHTVGQIVARDAGGRATRLTGTHRDITARRAADETLRLQQLALDAVPNAVVIVDAQAEDKPIVHVNPAFETITGYPPADVIGRNCRFLQGGDLDQPAIDQVRDAVRSGSECTVLLRNYRKDGTLFWNKLHVSPLRNDAGVLTHFIGIQSDLTEIKNYQSELEYRANYDTLTGLPNKNLLQDRLRHAISYTDRSRRKFALLYIDLDRFKIVNDSMGHSGGDELLRTVAERLKASVRESDTVARIAGDEFVLLLHDLDHPPALVITAQKLVREIEQPILIHGQEVFTSASVGVTVFPDDGDDAAVLIKNADTAMYRAKHRGRAQVCFYTEDLNADALERLKLDADLRRALPAGELEVHYQPRVELGTGRITSVEALVRWRHATRGLVSPAQFIPLAEETGLIVPLGEWVLRASCVQMCAWRDAGRTDMRVAVNLSPRQFNQPDLVRTITRVLAETGLEARHLELEITEGSAMQDPGNTQKVLEELSALGVAIAIDDFGTGYSSLAYLKRFPIDYLKIDQSFIRGIPHDRDDDKIVRSIIALGRSLEVVLIAEGVETPAQKAMLEAHGCHEMQGYLFCRPKPAHELEAVFAGA